MFFKFIRYVTPTWYFNLAPRIGSVPYVINISLLDDGQRKVVQMDYDYSSEIVSMLDSAYQAFHKGIINTDSKFMLDSSLASVTLSDEYHFIRKYYKSFWGLYILFIRILTLHNPFKEIIAYAKNNGVKKQNLNLKFAEYPEYHAFKSKLLDRNPFVSIIIPTLNRYRYLEDVIKDLEIQDYSNFEVIIIDQSENFNSEFYKNRSIELRVIEQKEKALWQARNSGIKIAKGDYLLFYDDDSRVGPDWITQHLKALDYFDADISSGVSLSLIGAEVPLNYSYFRWGDQIDTGNFLIKKDVFKTTGLFDCQFERQRMGDGEFGLRCYLNGFRNVSNPIAKRIHLKVSEGGLRQMGSWDAFRPRSIFSPRPIPSVNYLVRKYFGNNNAILNLLINVPPSIMPYRFKGNTFLMLLGSVLFVLILPIFIGSILVSWHKSTLMLNQGQKIEFLKADKD